jgi:hypothetical protein
MAQRRPYPITLDERRLATQLSRFRIPPPRSLKGQCLVLPPMDVSDRCRLGKPTSA